MTLMFSSYLAVIEDFPVTNSCRKRYATATAKKIDIRPHIVVRAVNKKTTLNHLLGK